MGVFSCRHCKHMALYQWWLNVSHAILTAEIFQKLHKHQKKGMQVISVLPMRIKQLQQQMADRRSLL